MRSRWRKLLALVRAEIGLREVLCFGGLGCVAYGLAQVYAPAAWIVPGAALFWLGVKR